MALLTSCFASSASVAGESSPLLLAPNQNALILPANGRRLGRHIAFTGGALPAAGAQAAMKKQTASRPNQPTARPPIAHTGSGCGHA